MTRHPRRGTKYQTDEPNHPASRGTMRRWVIGMLVAVIGLLPSVGTALVCCPPPPEGLYVTSFAVDPTTPTTLYAGTTDGILKSTNGGGSWQTVNTGLTNLGVNALVLDPAIPTTLYAGTNGGGIFKSTDGGGSWRAVNTGLTYLFVYALALDPTSPNELYVGMYCGCGNLAPYIGIFKSTDGGENWQAVNNGLATLEVFAFAIDPTTPTTLYAGSNGSVVGIGGVFKSTNGGGSWQTASSGLPVAEAVIALAIDPITPTTLYAGTLSSGVFRSTNGGGSWQAVNTGLTNFSSGVYALALDPMNPTTLYAGTEGGGVFRSTDGGGHWQVVPGLADLNVNALALATTTPITLYAGTWGSGVFRLELPTPPIVITTLTPTLPSPQAVGTALSLSATVTGGTGAPQCKWLLTTDPAWATYTTLRTWAACTTPALWTPSVAGSYQVGLWARSSGNTVDAPEGGAAAVLAYTITGPVPLTITALSANLASPQAVGTALSLTATVSGGTSPQQCKWLLTTDPTWATYTTLRTWAACTTPALWTPSVAGRYQIGLWARSSGNTVDAPEGGAAAVLPYTITGPVPPTIMAISALFASPQAVGTALGFSAIVSGGTNPLQCKWLLTTDPSWATYSVLRTWQACTSAIAWTPSVAGRYQIGLWARSSGNTVDAPEGGAAAVLAYTITGPLPPTITGLSANLPSPQIPGTTLTLYATVSGGTSPQSCKWLVTTDPSWATYSVLRTWGACSTPAAWTPSVAGTYQVGLWARSSGNSVDAPEGNAAAVLSYTITGPLPPTILGLSASLASPQAVGTALSLTATVTGGTSPQSCKWLLTTDPSWATYSVLRTWGACSTPAAWTPTVAGSYQVGLWARSSGNTVDAPEGGAAAVLAYTVTPRVPSITSLTASPASPRVTGTPLTFSVTVTGGTAPHQCKWLVAMDPSWATYTVLREWQPCTTPATWTPTAPWSYQVGVWARSAGNTVDYPEASAALVYVVVSPVPDVRGTYGGSGSATQSSCTATIDNGVFPFAGSFAIPTQSGPTFNGTGTFTTGAETVTVTLAGTVTAAGQVSGTLTVFSGMGGTVSLSGTLVANTLTVSFTGQVREGSNTCNLTGSFTGTRP